jgi:hypothetical protein
MCASNVQNEPPYDIPEPQPPRTYVLAGDAPVEEPASVALAVLGEMLSEVEGHVAAGTSMYGSAPVPDVPTLVRLQTLREARERIADAEARL